MCKMSTADAMVPKCPFVQSTEQILVFLSFILKCVETFPFWFRAPVTHIHTY